MLWRLMPLAEFEEKELEGPLNAQLTGCSGRIWTPGQVLEAVVGFDAALMVTHAAFWASVGFSSAPPGQAVSSSWWPSWPSPSPRLRTPPHFRLNLFLQYKRPRHLVRGKEWKHWQKSYFRFELTPHQQAALEACATALGADGQVAYGSPAFFRRDDLFAHTEAQTLPAKTHFAPVMKLKNHAKYTYVSAHSDGKAHSDPIAVRPVSFLDGPPDDLPPPADGGGGDDYSPHAILRAARKAARASVATSPRIVGSREAFDRAIARAHGLLDFRRLGTDDRDLAAVDDHLVAAVFARMSGVQWLVGS